MAETQPEPAADDEGDEVEMIVSSKFEGGELFYELKWVGFPHSSNDWVPAKNLKNASELIDAFNQKFQSKGVSIP